jgi:MoaA/NifB/PqqE/SkfB family radical SAM enzyme
MKGDGDLSLAEIESIYKQLPRLDAVRLTGGEPFVRKDLPQILELAQQHLKPLGVHITTNGFLTDRIVELCENRSKKNILQLMVSLDGVEDKHNFIRGNTNAFRCAWDTLSALAPARKRLKLDLVVNQTIVDHHGVEQYRLLRERLKTLGIRHQAVVAYSSSATYNLERDKNLAPEQTERYTTFGEFSQRDFRDLFSEMQSDLAKLPWWSRFAKEYYLDGIRQRLERDGGSIQRTNPKCVALTAHLRIFPNGDIPTCQFNSRVIGNLRQSSFADVWNRECSKEQRDWVNACQGCWAECEVIPSAIYTLDIVSKKRALPPKADLTADKKTTLPANSLPSYE